MNQATHQQLSKCHKTLFSTLSAKLLLKFRHAQFLTTLAFDAQGLKYRQSILTAAMSKPHFSTPY